ncbi:alpha-amylase family glycosyl hydrolase [Herbiconiux sp. P15]|uniref:alpha-amylase family glycosyl hydrolase n=1 Tax=Herbiconiux liukaitaii TaxID=3342799 RepID=UPI0035B8BA9C
MTAEWTEHVMWWHVYPLGFVGAPIRPERPEHPEAPAPNLPVHRLPAIEAWLDHVIELGLNGLLLGPVFASTTHGYDTIDHDRIDDRLGDDADFDHLVVTAREKGIRVLLDGVFNHVGREHALFRHVEENGPDSPHAALFRIDWTGWQPGQPVAAEVFEGHDALVALNHDAPEVADLVVGILSHWLDRGIDGWRLDAAYAVPAAFWREVLPRVRERHPEAWFTGEVIHGADAELAERSTIDSFTQYELWQATWHGIVDRNLFELAHALDRHDALLESYVPSTFVGNHDVTRIASAVGEQYVGHTLAVLFTVAGVPSIYAGDEYGWTGVKEERIGGDDAVRPAFAPAPPAESELPPPGARILGQHRQLIALRRRHAWLHHARTTAVGIANETLTFRTVAADSSEALLTALNLSDAPLRVETPGSASVAAGTATREGGVFVVPAREWAVIEVS